MAELIKAALTTRGIPAVRDSNMFLCVSNGEGTGTVRWRCSKRSCSATVTTRKSTENLVEEKLPDHSHLFAPCLWNHFDTLLADGVQTNNLLESFNRTFNKLAGTSPNVWKIHELFRSTEADTRRLFMHLDKTNQPKARKQKYLRGPGQEKIRSREL